MVVLDKKGERTEGTLYADDGETFEYQLGAYIHRKFTFENGQLQSTDLGARGLKTTNYLKTMKDMRVEKIIVVNAPAAWSSVPEVTVTEGGVKGSRNVELPLCGCRKSCLGSSKKSRHGYCCRLEYIFPRDVGLGRQDGLVDMNMHNREKLQKNHIKH